ncbi:MAG TPA: aspartate aminotransferase family protein [Steroidobacteraceae bacterium]|nr:aspartate aminotransferase family protein [Steroidobacteraceae bacterium]
MTDHVFHRSTRSGLPTVVGGRGIELIAADGRRFIDACGGAAVSCLGHGHPVVTRAIARQAEAIAYAHTSFFTNEPAEALADRLAAAAPACLSRVYFVDNGSAAVETALKMARQYQIERGAPGRMRVISRRQSYHGNTLGALAVSGNLGRRAPYEPFLFEASRIDPCFEYRYARDGQTAEDYGRQAAAALEAEILRVGPETVMAFIAETVVGATTGAVPPAPGYLRRIREICDRHDVLLILDEVMCGAGRTGSFLACEQEGVVPDIVTLAKGLAGGYQPIGAVLCSDKIYEAFAAGTGAFVNGHTYSAHAIACATALAVQDVIRDEDLLSRVGAAGARLRERLAQRFGRHRYVGDVRGRGLLMAIELVADRETKMPFDPALRMSARIKTEAFERGLLVYPGSGTVDGRQGDHVLLAPPYIVTDAEVDVIVERLGVAVDAATADIT